MMLPKPAIVAATALFLHSALAQIPATLSDNFDTEMQVSYSGDSSQGFTDGETVPFPDTAEPPVYALGDSSGVNTRISYMVMMLDTTDPTNFIMHYLKTDFKATGEKTGLASSATPIVPYAKPGSLGETAERQYTFLLYQQKQPDPQGVPQAGEKFDYEAFGAANGLEPPKAGLAMKVIVGDTSVPVETSTSSSPPPPPSSSAAPTTISPPAATSTESEVGTPASTNALTFPPEASPSGTGNPSNEGLTVKPTGILIGGGFVSEQPFPEGTNGEVFNVIANMVASYGSVTNLRFRRY